jgi:hypothetical protein
VPLFEHPVTSAAIEYTCTCTGYFPTNHITSNRLTYTLHYKMHVTWQKHALLTHEPGSNFSKMSFQNDISTCTWCADILACWGTSLLDKIHDVRWVLQLNVAVFWTLNFPTIVRCCDLVELHNLLNSNLFTYFINFFCVGGILSGTPVLHYKMYIHYMWWYLWDMSILSALEGWTIHYQSSPSESQTQRAWSFSLLACGLALQYTFTMFSDWMEKHADFCKGRGRIFFLRRQWLV